MTFKDALIAAGFKTKAEFAKYIDFVPDTVTRWHEDPPRWAVIIVNLLIDKAEKAAKVAEILNQKGD